MNVLTPGELDQMNHVDDRDFVLVNVLPREDFLAKHIRTSVNVPLQAAGFVERVEEIAGSKEREVVVYCASVECDASTRAAQQLETAGFARVYDLTGGTRDWFDYKGDRPSETRNRSTQQQGTQDDVNNDTMSYG